MGRKKTKASKVLYQEIVPGTSSYESSRPTCSRSSPPKLTSVIGSSSDSDSSSPKPSTSHSTVPVKSSTKSTRPVTKQTSPIRPANQLAKVNKLRSSQQNEERERRKLFRRYTEVLMSSMKLLSFTEDNHVRNEVLLLIFSKGRWESYPQSNLLLLDWVRAYNKFGRIDGPGFNFMRRDFRSLLKRQIKEEKDFTLKFPYRSDQGVGNPAEKMKSDGKNVKDEMEQSTSKKVVEIVMEPKKSETKQKKSIAYFSEDEEDNLILSQTRMLIELESECSKKSVAAAIAFELTCIPEAAQLLKRLLLFEKHQLVTDWEIAKQAYEIRNIDWKSSPGMIRRCDEIAIEMIEIDKALNAIKCYGRHLHVLKMFKLIKICALQKPIKNKQCRQKCHHNPIDDNTDDDEDFEGLELLDPKSKQELRNLREHIGDTYLCLIRATEFFNKIRKVEEKDDPRGYLNYRHHQMLCSMNQP